MTLTERQLIVALAFCLALPHAEASAGDTYRVPKDKAIALARKALAHVVVLAEDTPVSVVRKPGDPSGTWVFRFDMDIPAGYFASGAHPEVTVNAANGLTRCFVWNDDWDGSRLPNPQAIAQYLLIPPQGQPTQPDRAVKLIRKWMDANRTCPDYGMGHDFAYARLARAFRASSNPDGLVDALQREVSLQPCPWAEYAARQQLAKLYVGRKQYDKAISQMSAAREAVKDGTTSILTTRHALSLFEMGKIHLAAGDPTQAARRLEQYLDTENGRKNCFEPGKILGDLYESEEAWGKARALYKKIIETPFPNPSITDRDKEKFRQRLSLLIKRQEQARESELVANEVRALISNLGSVEASTRRAALDRLRRIGVPARVHLEKHNDDPDPEVRLAIRELLQK
jgi:tetratricopeptide (TPR) repeat protein